MTTLQIICLALGIVTFISMVIFKHKHDLKKRKQGIWITHWKETLKILLPFGTVSGAFFILATGTWEWWLILDVACMIMGSHWFFFDGIEGLSQGKGWWSTGGVDDKKKDSLPDRILRVFPLVGQKVIKIAALVLPISVYILTLWNAE